MLITKLYLILSGRSPKQGYHHHHHHHHHGPAEPSDGAVLLSSQVVQFLMWLTRCRRVTKRMVIKSAIASAVLTIVAFFLLYAAVVQNFPEGNSLVNLEDLKERSQKVRLSPKHTRATVSDDLIRQVISPQGKNRHKFHYGSNGQSFRNNKQTVAWDFEHLVQRLVLKPNCNSNAILLVLITTAPENANQRQAIRDTWCSQQLQHNNNNANFQCVFLVGHTDNARLNQNVSKEGSQNRDMLTGFFQDSYRNLTLKVLSGFFWSVAECTVPYVLKTDDDCFVNVNVFLQLLTEYPPPSLGYLYMGRISREKGHLKVIRESSSRWAVSVSDYFPNQYPPYARGSGYLLSQSLVQQLVQVSQVFKPFPNEDAYVGVLADMLGVRPMDSQRFTYYNMRWAVCNFLYFLVIHQVETLQQGELMAMAAQAPVKCKGKTFITSWE